MNTFMVASTVLLIACVMSVTSVVVEKFIVEPIFKPRTMEQQGIIDPAFKPRTTGQQGIVEPIFKPRTMGQQGIIDPAFKHPSLPQARMLRDNIN